MSSGYKWKIFGFNIGAYCRSQVSNIGFVEENNLDICYIVIFIRVKFFFIGVPWRDYLKMQLTSVFMIKINFFIYFRSFWCVDLKN